MTSPVIRLPSPETRLAIRDISGLDNGVTAARAAVVVAQAAERGETIPLEAVFGLGRLVFSPEVPLARTDRVRTARVLSPLCEREIDIRALLIIYTRTATIEVAESAAAYLLGPPLRPLTCTTIEMLVFQLEHHDVIDGPLHALVHAMVLPGPLRR